MINKILKKTIVLSCMVGTLLSPITSKAYFPIEDVENRYYSYTNPETGVTQYMIPNEFAMKEKINSQGETVKYVEMSHPVYDMVYTYNIANGKVSMAFEYGSTGYGKIGQSSTKIGYTLDDCYGSQKDYFTLTYEVDWDRTFETLDLINTTRTAKGLEPLYMNAAAMQEAMARTYQVAAFYSHTYSTMNTMSNHLLFGLTPYDGFADGENISAGHADAKKMHTAYMNSPGHAAAILSDRANCMGTVWLTDRDGYLKANCETFWKDNGNRQEYPRKSGKEMITMKVPVLDKSFTKGDYWITWDNTDDVEEDEYYIESGKSIQLNVLLNSNGTEGHKQVTHTAASDYTWSSSKSVATVSNGKVSGKKSGTTTITAKVKNTKCTNNNAKVTKTIKVVSKPNLKTKKSKKKVTLTWNKEKKNTDGTRIQMKKNGGKWKTIKKVDSKVGKYTKTLKKKGNYSFRVKRYLSENDRDTLQRTAFSYSNVKKVKIK